MEEIYCPKCDRNYPERALKTTTTTTEQCRVCDTTLRVTEPPFSMRDDAGQELGDVSAIDQWLEEATEEVGASVLVRKGDPSGRFLWLVQAPGSPWPLRLCYQSGEANYFSVAVVCETVAAAVQSDSSALQSVCASSGIQADGMSGHDAVCGTTDGWWGACVAIKIQGLTPILFAALATRLQTVTREALACYGGKAV